MYAEPGKIFLPALPRLVVPDLLGGDGPSLDVHAVPDLLVDEVVDLDAKPTSDLSQLSGPPLGVWRSTARCTSPIVALEQAAANQLAGWSFD